MIEEIIIYSTISGGVYALLALGFTLIYGVSGVVNLAHGSFYMLGAYMFYVLGPKVLELPPILAVILAVVFVGVVSSILYRLTIHPVLGDEVGVMVVTVCLALIFQQLMLLVFGPPNVPVAPLIEGSVPIWGVKVTYARILAFAISLVLFASLWIFISKSKIGKAMRAVSQDREVAMLMGINTEKLYMLAMATSSMLAAVAGIFISGSTSGVAGAWIWMYPLALSFSIVILGGLGSIKGSLIGGFIIGYAEQTVIIVAPEGGQIVSVVPFTVMVLVLLLRPKGLFGKRIEMED
ncbi:MAG: branched-chain amino acid ABC transporter permease [Candidatus Bathyarchaeota archaeon]|nr:branched-chain amino acid ABC transporter permease [Candidatus Bathyarchaeota archaeon]MDH5745819.1 branched-chain amino acid ABC transporter permease [Candidatus Bathyarchaeota archaeon]